MSDAFNANAIDSEGAVIVKSLNIRQGQFLWSIHIREISRGIKAIRTAINARDLTRCP